MPFYRITYSRAISQDKSVVVTASDEEKAWEIAEKLPDEDFEFGGDIEDEVEWGDEPAITLIE